MEEGCFKLGGVGEVLLVHVGMILKAPKHQEEI